MGAPIDQEILMEKPFNQITTVSHQFPSIYKLLGFKVSYAQSLMGNRVAWISDPIFQLLDMPDYDEVERNLNPQVDRQNID